MILRNLLQLSRVGHCLSKCQAELHKQVGASARNSSDRNCAIVASSSNSTAAIVGVIVIIISVVVAIIVVVSQ